LVIAAMVAVVIAAGRRRVRPPPRVLDALAVAAGGIVCSTGIGTAAAARRPHAAVRRS
jgi:hypothetical protein